MIIKSFRLFESKLEYLESFENILRMMDSNVAKHLLGISGKDLDLVANFISVGGDDFLNFIPDKKSSEVKIVYKVVSTRGFLGDHYEYHKVCKEYGVPNCELPRVGSLIYFERELNPDVLKRAFPDWKKSNVQYYMSVDETKGYVYLPADVYSIEKCDQIIGPKPQQIKIGRLAKNLVKITGVDFSDKDIEEFVNEFKSKYELLKNAFRNFHLVLGKEISYWYLGDMYCNTPKGPLHNSCMRYSNCQGYFSIYEKNPEVCMMVVLKSDFDQDKITGRALVWKLENGDIFMDRIYYSKESDVNLFIEYAKSNGWAYKSKQGSGGGEILLNGNRYDKDLSVKLDNFDFKYYPYVDTLHYLSEDGHLSTKHALKSKDLRRDNGGYIGVCGSCDDGRVECDSCGGSGKEDCYDCGGSGVIYCNSCNGDGEIECSDCDGSGEIDGKECPQCKGSKNIDCPDCSSGRLDCDTCHGNGNYNCGDCDGDGTVPCPDCN
jgi:hypothetical protein